MRRRISIRGRVRPSVGPSVRPVLFSKVISTHTRRILCRVSGLVLFCIASFFGYFVSFLFSFLGSLSRHVFRTFQPSFLNDDGHHIILNTFFDTISELLLFQLCSPLQIDEDTAGITCTHLISYELELYGHQ